MNQIVSASGSVPGIVVAADWSVDAKKRWMVRAERVDSATYLVSPPEPVGNPSSLIPRLRGQLATDESLLLGFDFPIGLPLAYARQNDITTFRATLATLGKEPWDKFYEISDTPNPRQPFFPHPTQVPGRYKTQLAEALAVENLSALLRRCDAKTKSRRAAECLFFTLGGSQVGRAAIVGWRDVIQPSLDRIKLWPFDGEFSSLIAEPGITIAEIYPAEAYSHLGVKIGGVGRSKTSQEARREAVKHWVADFNDGPIRLSKATQSWVEWGFASEDDFDAMAGLLSMLQVVCGLRPSGAPNTDEVRKIEGWILGQRCDTEASC